MSNKEYYQTHKEEIQKAQRDYYQKHKDTIKARGKQYRLSHKEQEKTYRKLYYIQHKEQVSVSSRQRYKANREVMLKRTKDYYQTHREEIRERATAKRASIKIDVLTHYGNGKCDCVKCGFNDIQALTIDHINSGGTKHRKELGAWGYQFYRKLQIQGYPKGFQTLCMNCQLIKEIRGKENRWNMRRILGG